MPDQEAFAASCDAHRQGRSCPITSTPCPGECVFADTLRNLQVGILVLDCWSEKVLFRNAEAHTILHPHIDSRDFRSLGPLFSPVLDGDSSGSRHTVQLGGRILGFSVYYVVRGLAWVFIHDITERERLQSLAEAVNSMDSIGFTFSGIRHELGNPVNSIKMTLSVLRDRLDKCSRETIEEYIARCLDAVSRVEYLLQSLKSFNIYESLAIQDIDVADFLRSFKRLVERDLSVQGIALGLRLEPGMGRARLDPRALQQVMLNLIGNASEALSERSDPEIAIKASRTDDIVLVRVIDNGVGIAAGDLPHLFKPFYTTKEEGTGLGLVIARRMLARMGGCIEVESREDEGTLVTLTIPGSEGDET